MVPYRTAVRGEHTRLAIDLPQCVIHTDLVAIFRRQFSGKNYDSGRMSVTWRSRLYAAAEVKLREIGMMRDL